MPKKSGTGLKKTPGCSSQLWNKHTFKHKC